MPDSVKTEVASDPAEERGDESVAYVIRNREILVTARIQWSNQHRAYVLSADEPIQGADLEMSDNHTIIIRLGDMYLEGFREGYERGYDAYALEQAERTRERLRTLLARWHAHESDRRNRDHDQGDTQGHRPDR